MLWHLLLATARPLRMSHSSNEPSAHSHTHIHINQAASYWYNQIATFHKEVEFDGLWIDMNEPSTATVTPCGKDKYTNPPYVWVGAGLLLLFWLLLPRLTIDVPSLPASFQPAVAELSLDFATMCMNAETALGPHYNVHSLVSNRRSPPPHVTHCTNTRAMSPNKPVWLL